MIYKYIVAGTFLSRLNCFIAHVGISGRTVMCHAKDTGWCRELLIPGVAAILECHPGAGVTGHKIEYDLIGVYKGNVLINMDSQVPSRAAWEWLETMKGRAFPEPGANPGDTVRTPDSIRREMTHGDPHFGLVFTLDHMDGKNQAPAFMEIKGVTLEDHGMATFPDAPTLRGIKHLYGLARAVREGYDTYILFAIQMKGIKGLKPNNIIHPAFRKTLREAPSSGVYVLAYDCIIAPDTMTVDQSVPVFLD